MSENLDLVRSIFASWERGDFSSTEWMDADIEFEGPDGLDGSRSVGIAALAEGWRVWLSTWQDYRVEADEYRELDGDRVLVLMQHGGRGKLSGVQVEQLKSEGANVFDLRDGKVARLALYWDRDRALADLGLKE
jgi:ketosteroid isomerase-like protein